MHIVRNSGKDYNDYGRYDDCVEEDGFNFYMATILHRFPIPMSTGLCLPKQCSLSDLEEFKPFLLKVVNGVLPSLLEGVRGFDHTGDSPITQDDLLFVDVARENGKVNGFGGGAALVCSVLVTFLILVSVSTVMLWKQKEHNKKKNVQEDWELARAETRC